MRRGNEGIREWVARAGMIMGKRGGRLGGTRDRANGVANEEDRER